MFRGTVVDAAPIGPDEDQAVLGGGIRRASLQQPGGRVVNPDRFGVAVAFVSPFLSLTLFVLTPLAYVLTGKSYGVAETPKAGGPPL